MGKRRARRGKGGRRAMRALGSTWRWLRGHATALALVLLAAGGTIAARQVRSATERLPGFRVYPEVFRTVGEVPEWLGARDLADIRDAVAEVEPFGVFDRAVLPRVREAIEPVPWIREVVGVRPVLPDQVEVILRVRKPIAMVERAGSCYLVDRGAVRLPGRFARRPHGFTYPVPLLIGASFSRPPRPGNVWNDRAVVEGVAVALELRRLYDSDLGGRIAVDRIDVSNAGGVEDPTRSEIVLRTPDGVAIRWGRSLLYQGFGENPTARKLEQLREVEREWPSLRGLESVGVLFDEPVVRQEAPGAPGRTPREHGGAGPGR